MTTRKIAKGAAIALALCLTKLPSAEASHYRRSHVDRPDNICHLVPPNTQNISDDPADHTTKVDEATFMNILRALDAVYSPIVAQKGGQLVIVPAWKDDEVNAFATRTNNGQKWIVEIKGGLARHPRMTPDSLLLAACHEVGHHLGGAPYKPAGWKAAAEGESDYFAALKCMRLVLKQFNNSRIVGQLGPEVTPLVKQRCGTMGPDPEQMSICARTTVAGVHLGETLTEVTNDELTAHGKPALPPTDLGRPDPTVVNQTIQADYPGLQCRVDTYAAGAVCPVPASVEIQNDDVNSGVCVRAGQSVRQGQALAFTPGARPACWYRQF